MNSLPSHCDWCGEEDASPHPLYDCVLGIAMQPLISGGESMFITYEMVICAAHKYMLTKSARSRIKLQTRKYGVISVDEWVISEEPCVRCDSRYSS